MAKRKSTKTPKQVESLTHDEATRKNIPTAELQSAAQRAEEIKPFEPVMYKRDDPLPEGGSRSRDGDLDPQIIWKGATLRLNQKQIDQLVETGKLEIGDAQLVWRSKDQEDWSDLIVNAPPLYIQEKIHPKAIIDDLKKQTKEREDQADTFDLFDDFNGINSEARTEFYQHDQHWSNRMILGDSLQVMASLAEREGLRGKVQCIYFDPPYGIKFGSNWQVSTRSRDVKDGKFDQISREPEQVKAFRDTWSDGIHSYMTYARDRITAMRDLLTESGSLFVQIGDENVHRMRALLDEVLGEQNFVSCITFKKTGGQSTTAIPNVTDFIVWYARDRSKVKVRSLFVDKSPGDEGATNYTWVEDSQGQRRSLTASEKDGRSVVLGEHRFMQPYPMFSDGPSARDKPFHWRNQTYQPSSNAHWKTHAEGLLRLNKADRLLAQGKTLRFVNYLSDYSVTPILNVWTDTQTSGFGSDRLYVVQTLPKVIERCILMASDPGDLVFDPTCGSGTTATVAEQWGRRWITVDTSRVALALARSRIMGARYPYYYLLDSPEGQRKEQDVTGRVLTESSNRGDLRQGFVYQRAPHIMLRTVANNIEIDVIWDNFQTQLEPVRELLNEAVGESWGEWEIPLDASEDWSDAARELHAKWWELRVARQAEIDKSIAQKADVELLYDRPYEDTSKVRVAGPFTVESLSPHRVVPADEEGLVGDPLEVRDQPATQLNDFAQMVIENLKSAGVHQAAKDDRISFTTINGWPGTFIAAEGRFMEGEVEKRAAIFIGPEFGTVTRADLTASAREALDARFDALIACGFNFDAHTSELTKLGPLPILKAKMNPDLHMSEELKNTGAGNMFVVFGEPDIEWDFDDDGNIVVEVLGVDVFDPKTGDVRASGKDDIAAWFVDTDYDEESFFVRHAYFMGANDPYKSLKTSLKAEIDKEAWETLYRDKSRPFGRPSTGRFAVKVINHFGDEVMKVFGV